MAPLSGENAIFGDQMLNGTLLYLDRVNASGGVNGREVKLLIYDSEADKEAALRGSQDIAEKNQAMVVIGHYFSSLAVETGEVYKTHKIPAITSGAMSNDVVEGNEWFFRVIPGNRLAASFSADYIDQVMGVTTASIVYDDQDNFSVTLTDEFEAHFQELGGEIRHKWRVPSASNKTDDMVKWIIQSVNLLGDDEPGIIFFASWESEIEKVLVALKRHNLNPPTFGVAVTSLGEAFDEYPEEKAQPGYFSDGMYVASAFIFDKAGEEAQKFRRDFIDKYGVEPTELAVGSYDAALTAVQAIHVVEARGAAQGLAQKREKIREYLALLRSPKTAVGGLSGPIYFNEHGDAVKNMTIGRFEGRHIVSNLTQLNPVANPDEIANLDDEIAAGRVLMLDDHLMYKSSLVHTGLNFNEIGEFSSDGSTYILDFYLWFRFEGQIHPEDIEFLNAVEPIDLGEPIEEKAVDGLTYRRYHVKGKFKADSLHRYALGQHTLQVSFRHRELNENNLVYVTDTLGMGLDKDTTLAERLQEAQVLNPASGWVIKTVSFFQDASIKKSLGDPEILALPGGAATYSRFNVAAQIERREFTLRRLLSFELALGLLAASLLALIVLSLPVVSRFIRIPGYVIWGLKVIFAFLLLISGEIVLIDWLLDDLDRANFSLMILVFDILWWMVPASLLNSAVQHFIWTPLEEKTERSIPGVVRNFVAFIIYLLAIFGVIAFVFDRPITSLLATSGLIFTLIGLAIQFDISNIFSGIALNIERPFRPGDWIKIGSYDEGKVLDITWRTTRIETRMGNVVIIPNSAASQTVVKNFSYPDDRLWQGFTVQVSPEYRPERVEKILRDAVLSVQEVLEPWVTVAEIKDGLANYWVYFYVQDYGKRYYYNEILWKQVWTHLNRAGITPARKPQDIHLFQDEAPRDEPSSKSLRLLQEVDIFQPFSDEAKAGLSRQMQARYFAAGETVVHQGDQTNSLFIIAEGVVEVWVQFEDGQSAEVARLGVGGVFGEMALLTGETRNSTVRAKTDAHLYEITKEDISPLILEAPEISDRLSEILAERQLAIQVEKSSHQDQDEDDEDLKSQMLHKIQGFFGMK